METFTTHTGRAVPLRRSNVDTDQIIPAVYLKRVTRTGFEDGPVRRLAQRPRLRAEPAAVRRARRSWSPARLRHRLLARARRLGAADYGFRVVISPRFGDIFRGNSGKAGLLTASVAARRSSSGCGTRVEADPATEVTVDLVERQVTAERLEARLRDRRLHPLAADGGPGRHRPDPPPRRRHRRLRASRPKFLPRNRLTHPPHPLGRPGPGWPPKRPTTTM